MTWYITSIVGCASEPLRNSLEEYIESVDREFAKHATYSDGTAYAIWMTALNRVREINIRVKEHDAAIRSKECERLLKKFDTLAETKWFAVDVGDPDGNVCVVSTDDIENLIKSLREGVP